jgi:hypothetical protein
MEGQLIEALDLASAVGVITATGMACLAVGQALPAPASAPQAA